MSWLIDGLYFNGKVMKKDLDKWRRHEPLSI